jgi:glycosyltransferase involved in cell wall biosynthesis
MHEFPERRRTMLILVPHEPTLDPRVHYTANSLAKRYNVMMVAVVRDFEHRPEENYPPRPAYSTVRVPLRKSGTTPAIVDFCSLLVGQKVGLWNMLAATMLTCTVLVAATMLAVPVMVERAARAFVAAYLPWTRVASARSSLYAALSNFRLILQTDATLLGYIRRSQLVADYVYCHDLYSLQAAVILKRTTGCRIIYDSHEFYPYLHRGWMFRLLTRFYEGVLVSFVDTYITVSPPLARELEKMYGRSGIVAIPNVEPFPVEAPARVEGDMTTLVAGRLKLLYQGNFAEGRGLEEVLQEWQKVDDTRAALFLRGPQNQWRDRLEVIARETGLLGKSIYFLPPVLERDLITAAREADAGLIPYKAESEAYRFACPNKLSQFLHAGLAIVANSIPFVRAMVDEQGIGLCYDVDEASSFARTINLLARDPTELARLRSNALSTARNSYRWEKYEDALLASIETV